MPAYAAPDHIMVSHGDAKLEVLAQGKGPTIVMLPSLGRGATDFDAIADKLAEAGFRVLRPEPRGIGKSTGPWQGVKLEDLAADVAAIIEQDKNGPAFVVGHAFGNRVARMLATARPELVAGVSLIAANVGRNPSPGRARGHSSQRRSQGVRRRARQGDAVRVLRAGQRRAGVAEGLVSGRSRSAANCR